MTSRYQMIRQWLGTQDGPRTPGEIAAGIGAKSSRAFTVVLGNMLRDGWLVRKRDGVRRLYSLTEKAPPRKATAAQLAERARQRQRERYRAKGGRTRAQWLEERRRAAAERRAQYERDVALRREQRAAERAKRAGARAAVAKPLHDRKAKPHVVVRLAPPAAPKKEVPRESVEQWMARTGKTPQVLPIGAVSKPLGFINFNNSARKAA
ncbi:hypothetical protein [Lysobacter auxotrophicus]|uniref:Uncharacterized protein n=1 Tax=Lysobacter auxotrophicus TaxID=2992573 RepID=A0ABM8DG26_9GAMM|nr:hypothetical protein [Lysobacter auxotrophicus]BDU17561.1 hypothetical protein LA521A_27620 [Lysobacter auxotrophicus]